MLKTINKNSYQAFGYNIVSDIPLPELQHPTIQSDEADVFVEKSDITSLWIESEYDPNKFVVKEDYVLFQVTDIATFLIQGGRRIVITPMSGSDENKIRLYILGSCMSILLMQRKILPLHGSAIAIEGKAYAFVGDKGAGKSTLATAFLNRGYQLLSDDVIPVTLSEDHIPYVIPSYPQQKLWLESLNHFGMDTSQYLPLFERETKYSIPVSSQFSSTPLPLAGVFELSKIEKGFISINSIERLDRIRTLFSHTFRPFLISRLGLLEWHLNYTTRLASQIEMNRLHRPSSEFTVDQLTDLILSTIKKGEKND